MAGRLSVVAVLGVVTLLLVVTAGAALTGVFGIVGTDGAAGTAGDRPVTETSGELPFDLAIQSVEACGTLCRNVTSTVTNEQSVTAENVTVRTRLYAGNDTDGEVRWRGVEQVGTLEPGATRTVTRRVSLSLDAALAIRDAGGWVTIRTTVESDDATVTVIDRRDVT